MNEVVAHRPRFGRRGMQVTHLRCAERLNRTRRPAVLLPAVVLLTVLLPVAVMAESGGLRILDVDRTALSLPPMLAMDQVCALTAEQVALCDIQAHCPAAGAMACGALVGGIDHVAAGLGLRNRDRGTLHLRHAAPGARAVAAWAYWGVITARPGTPEGGTIEIAGQTFFGEVVGVAEEPCWDAGTSFVAYRAWVLPAIGERVNGDYPVVMPGDWPVVDGRSPWEVPQGPPPHLEGVSLIVAYARPSARPDAQFYLHEGTALLAGELQVFHSLEPPLPEAEWARFTRMGADGQQRTPTHGMAPVRTEIRAGSDLLQPLIGTPIRGPGSVINPHGDWQGGDGTELWDTQTDILEASQVGLNGGSTWYQVDYRAQADESLYYDCADVVAHAMSLH